MPDIALCIDDFGLSEGVNQAVLDLAARGRVQAVSCMVGAPQWRAGATALARLPAGTLDAGLHLDLIDHPLTCPRHSLRQLLLQSHARLLDRAALRREIDAQLDAFEQGLGRAPAYVDGHQHVHQFPVIRALLVQALLRRYPAHRPWLRATRRPAQAALPGGLKPRIIEGLGSAALARLARRHGFAQNAHLLGVYDFQADAPAYRALLRQWLGAARAGDLLMCHAGLGSAPGDAIAAARRAEYEVLASPDFAALLEQAGVRLVPLSRLAHGAQAASL